MKNIDKLLNYLIAAVVILIAASFFIFKEPNTQKKNKMTSTDVNKIVNKHLQQAVDQNRLIELKTEAALRAARKKVEDDIRESRRKQDEANMNIPLDRQVWSEAEMAERIRQAEAQNGVTNSGTDSVRSPDNAIPTRKKKPSAAQDEDFDVKTMTPAEKKEYVRQYKENARKGGFEIELDENLEVTSSTPIRKPSKQDDSVDNLPTD